MSHGARVRSFSAPVTRPSRAQGAAGLTRAPQRRGSAGIEAETEAGIIPARLDKTENTAGTGTGAGIGAGPRLGNQGRRRGRGRPFPDHSEREEGIETRKRITTRRTRDSERAPAAACQDHDERHEGGQQAAKQPSPRRALEVLPHHVRRLRRPPHLPQGDGGGGGGGVGGAGLRRAARRDCRPGLHLVSQPRLTPNCLPACLPACLPVCLSLCLSLLSVCLCLPCLTLDCLYPPLAR